MGAEEGFSLVVGFSEIVGFEDGFSLFVGAGDIVGDIVGIAVTVTVEAAPISTASLPMELSVGTIVFFRCEKLLHRKLRIAADN